MAAAMDVTAFPRQYARTRRFTLGVRYGRAVFIVATEMQSLGPWWAPDGERLMAARVDDSAVQHWWIADPANPHLPPREIVYPAAGTANPDVSLHVLGMPGDRAEITWDRAALEYLVAAGWDARGPLLSVQSRDQRTVRVLAADPATGAAILLHEERDPVWVHLTPGAPLRTGSGALVRVSDLDGSRRLVVDGKPVTGDGVQVREVLGTGGASVLFTASEEPTEEHVWSYDHCSPVSEAALLRRPLLLVHGLADDNVVAAHTLRMSAALLAAGRPHRVLPLSGSAHRPTDETTVTQLLLYQLDFLRETLATGAVRAASRQRMRSGGRPRC